jgi:hypothetical protein
MDFSGTLIWLGWMQRKHNCEHSLESVAVGKSIN